MATIGQIYNLINDAMAQATGGTANTVKDTSTFVSLGKDLEDGTYSRESFFNVLYDRIGRTAFAIRKITARQRAVRRDKINWGLFYQKISFKDHAAVDNPSWEFATQANPYDVEPQTEIVQKMFGKLGTWSFEDTLPEYQLYTAFDSEERFAAFVSAWYLNIDNALEISITNTDNMAVDTYMAGALAIGTAGQKRNLLAEYNAQLPAGETALTAANCRYNPDFLRFATTQINLAVKYLRSPSKLYNAEGITRITPSDKVVVEILSEFAAISASYLQSDTYHKELVSLPKYEEINYWQGMGATGSFDERSTINILNTQIQADAIVQSGIIAFVHDIDAVASYHERRGNRQLFNPRAERMNVFVKADVGYGADLSENGIVFYIADPTE